MKNQATAVVQIAGLCKTFKDFWRRPKVEAVRDLNLDILPGEVFGLLGPNGSGKSTTIKMILGLLYPTKGRLAVFGKAPTDVNVKKRIGFLPEESYLYRFLNATETLDYFGRLFQLPPRARVRRTEMLLDMVGLKHEAKRPIGEYSKGMARRIGLAQALINDPEFLILDEPTSGMDPIGTRQIKDVIRELGSRGKTILLSSHLLADVEDVCDRVTILYGGRQQAAGHMRDLLGSRDQMQITLPRVASSTLDQIRALLHRLEDKDILEVATPRVKLEDFFIRVVDEARRANLATSGVAGAGRLAEFLGRSDAEATEEVVESLMGAASAAIRPDDEPVALPDPPRDEEPSQEILSQLAPKPPNHEPAPFETGETLETPPLPSSEPQPVHADPSVIDDLLTSERSPKEREN